MPSNRGSTSPLPQCSGTSGLDPAAVDPDTDFLADPAVRTDELVIPDISTEEGADASEDAVANVQRIDSRKLFGSPSTGAGLAPDSFVTLDGLRRRGWKQAPSGWLVEAGRPLTSEQVADAREFAADAGLTIETRRESSSDDADRHRNRCRRPPRPRDPRDDRRPDPERDRRRSPILTATGATSRIRRTLTAATAGSLAFLGALLGVAGAYLALAATYLDDLDYPGRIPVLPLVLMGWASPWRPQPPAGCSPAGSPPTSPHR